MKTLIIASIVAAFACVSTVQAGENKQACAASACCAEKSACAAKAKADLAKAKAAASEKGATLLVKR